MTIVEYGWLEMEFVNIHYAHGILSFFIMNGIVLHMFASTRRLLQAPLYWSSTDFALRDLWKVDLTQVDVVAVYGLAPIMNQLGVKMKAELPAGTLIVSNVFPIPGWRTSVPVEDGVHLYVTPHCWGDPSPK